MFFFWYILFLRRDKFPYSNFFLCHTDFEQSGWKKHTTPAKKTYNSNIKSHFLNHIVVTQSLFGPVIHLIHVLADSARRIQSKLTQALSSWMATRIRYDDKKYWKLHCSITFCIYNKINLAAFFYYIGVRILRLFIFVCSLFKSRNVWTTTFCY